MDDKNTFFEDWQWKVMWRWPLIAFLIVGIIYTLAFFLGWEVKNDPAVFQFIWIDGNAITQKFESFGLWWVRFISAPFFLFGFYSLFFSLTRREKMFIRTSEEGEKKNKERFLSMDEKNAYLSIIIMMFFFFLGISFLGGEGIITSLFFFFSLFFGLFFPLKKYLDTELFGNMGEIFFIFLISTSLVVSFHSGFVVGYLFGLVCFSIFGIFLIIKIMIVGIFIPDMASLFKKTKEALRKKTNKVISFLSCR